jgi:hypothetical protein
VVLYRAFELGDLLTELWLELRRMSDAKLEPVMRAARRHEDAVRSLTDTAREMR